MSSASSIALIAVSDEMSFSLSRLRSTLRSMSIAASSKVPGVFSKHRVVKLRITNVVKFGVRNPAELHLDAARAHVGIGEPAFVAGQAERDAAGVSREHPSFQGTLP